MILTESARAKVNLALHVTGRRSDGYHLLDTLVAFPDVCDRLTAIPDDRLSLVVEGPQANALDTTAPADNLVIRAARGLAEIAGGNPGALVTLEKHLPVAAGIGGGSADAAAAIRLLCRLWSIETSDPKVGALALSLGADVPMCLLSRPLRAKGIGEELRPIELPAGLGIVLVNPGVAVPTAAVFRGLAIRDNAPIPADPPSDAAGFLAAVAGLRNDLEVPALGVAPDIATVIDTIRATSGCRLARMSGSGATCFGLYDDAGAATAAAAWIASGPTSWWVAAALLS